MAHALSIIPEPLTAAAFAPFGQIMAGGGGENGGGASMVADHLRAWPMDFDVDGAVQVLVIHYKVQPLRLSLMERHFAVSQAFVPLGNQASVMVVAEAVARPSPEAVRAFRVPGDVGVLLRRRTWHALTRFPVGPGGGAFVMITSEATQKELEREAANGGAAKLTEVIDFEREYGTSIEIAAADE